MRGCQRHRSLDNVDVIQVTIEGTGLVEREGVTVEKAFEVSRNREVTRATLDPSAD